MMYRLENLFFQSVAAVASSAAPAPRAPSASPARGSARSPLSPQSPALFSDSEDENIMSQACDLAEKSSKLAHSQTRIL